MGDTGCFIAGVALGDEEFVLRMMGVMVDRETGLAVVVDGELDSCLVVQAQKLNISSTGSIRIFIAYLHRKPQGLITIQRGRTSGSGDTSLLVNYQSIRVADCQELQEESLGFSVFIECNRFAG